ncbi:MAG: hypothetical protein WCG34_10750, partial [Leptolinea sp.]
MKANLLFIKSSRILLCLSVITVVQSATNVLASTGSLDPAFGVNGVVSTRFNEMPSSAGDAILQADGKIIVLGNVKLLDEQSGKIIARYNSNGTVDTSFGVNGIVRIDVASFIGSKIALQPGGKLIVAGKSGEAFAVVRYSSDGTLDTSFGTNGMGIFDFGGNDVHQALSDVAIQLDGKIVIVGDNGASFSTRVDLIFVRFNSNGTEDIGNVIYFPNSHDNYGKGVLIQPDGKIILAGLITDDDGRGPLLALARINPDGSLDTSTFGTDGEVTIPFYDFDNSHSALGLQADGKIVLTGTVFNNGGIDGNLAVARFNSNGSLDASFGETGIVITDFGADESINDLAIQPGGKIILGGETRSLDPNDTAPSDFLLARYNSDGSLDTSFGTNGKLITDFGNNTESASSIVIQPDSKVVVVGASGDNAILARYETGTSSTTSLTFNSVDAYDGWILESGENTSQGGTLDKIAKVIFVGDDFRDRQYRGILSFNTISIPDNALITSALLKIKKQTEVGTDPFTTHGDLLLDIRGGTFGNNINLTVEDFSAIANIGSIQEKFLNSTLNWYTANLNNINLGFVNKFGLTQFRLLFSRDDNDDMGDDYIKFFSSGSAASDQPQLIVTYSISSGGNTNTHPPVITSNGGDTTANIDLPENTTSVTTGIATDADLPMQVLTYSITGGADAALFGINPSTGTLAFVTAPGYNAPNDAGLDHVYNVTVQASDGTLIDSQELVISILNPNPSPVSMFDSTFGLNGVVTTKINGLPSSTLEVVLQPDGKIVTLVNVKLSADQSKKAITRYNTNGTFDTSFGTNGSIFIEVTPFFGSKIALQSDGKLIVAGVSNGGYAVVRYYSNGTLDTSFGTNGMGALDTDSDHLYSARDVTVQPDGKIVVVGDYQFRYGNHIDFQIARFNSDGTRDINYTLDWSDFPASRYNWGKAVVIQPDNKIVMSGDMLKDDDGKNYISLARLNSNGTTDKSTFGINGKGTITARLDYFQNSSGALALQPDGKIVVAGTIFNMEMDAPQNLVVSRFNSDSSL